MEEVKINGKSFFIVFAIIAAIALLVFILNSYDGSRKNELIVSEYTSVESSTAKLRIEELVIQSDTSKNGISDYEAELAGFLKTFQNNDSGYRKVELFVQKGKSFYRIYPYYNQQYNTNSIVSLNKDVERTLDKMLTNKENAVLALQEFNANNNNVTIINLLNTKTDKLAFLKTSFHRN